MVAAATSSPCESPTKTETGPGAPVMTASTIFWACSSLIPRPGPRRPARRPARRPWPAGPRAGPRRRSGPRRRRWSSPLGSAVGDLLAPAALGGAHDRVADLGTAVAVLEG